MLPDWLAHRAATTPERIAVIVGSRQWTCRELDADVADCARRLAEHGVRTGDRIATLLTNGASPVLLAHAVLRIGAVLVPLNTRLSDTELAWQLDNAAPRTLIVDDRTAALAKRALQDRPTPKLICVDTGGRLPPPPARSAAHDASMSASAPRLAHDPTAVFAIIYTSGTTGRPKGAMLTVGNFWWSAIGSALNLGTRNDDRWLACLPLFHVGGLSILTRCTILGSTAVIHDGFDADAVNRAIDDEGITIISVVAVMLARMLDARADRPYPPTLRCVLVGGGPVPRSLLERCAAIRVPVVQTYGLTETASQVATLAPDDALRKLGAAGRALYPNEIRIARTHGAPGHDAAVDEPGEILVRGPVVMAGYVGESVDTDRAIVDGWLHTGDIGHIDADGYLHVLDRRVDLIITGGENVYPAEVEAALLAHPAVIEAGVIGLSDASWGRRVVAIVRVSSGMSGDIADTLRLHCRTLLAGYKVPREIRIVDQPLPRTASGKLQRTVLSAREASPT